MGTMKTVFAGGILAIVLLLSGFGTTAEAGTFSWVGGNSGAWESGSSWQLSGGSSSSSYPVSGDIAVFSSSATVTLSGNLTITTLSIQSYSAATTVTLVTDNTLTCTNVIVGDGSSYPATLILQRSTTTGFVLSTQNLDLDNGTITSATAAKMELTRGGTGSITMADVSHSYVGSGVLTTIAKTDPFASHARFDDDLTFSTAANAKILLGAHNLYLGKYCTLAVPDSAAGASGGFIATYVDPSKLHNVPNAAIGRLCREVDATFGGPHHFPVGLTGSNDKCVPITIEIDNDPNYTSTSLYSTSTINPVSPFPHISVRVVGEKHPENLQDPYFGLYWVVQGVGTPDQNGGDICISLTFTYHNLYRSNNPSNLYSARYTDNYEDNVLDSGWDLTGTQSSPAQNNVRPVNMGGCVPGFGDFTIGFGDPFGGDPIPVELTSFSARLKEHTVHLQWETATELNNYGFAIERSTDREHWEEIAFVEGFGTSNSPKSYSYADEVSDAELRHPELIYRLRQIDRDGTTDYSNIVMVQTGGLPEGVELHAAYPNPFNPATTISFSVAEATHVTLRVYNTLGQTVATLLEGHAMDAGLHTMAFNAETLPSGLYMAVLEAGGVIQQQKLVLNK
jgi:hypothetical protein